MSDDIDKLDEAWKGTEPAKSTGGWTPIPEGTRVKVVISDQKPGLIGDKKTPGINTVFEVVEPEEYKGRDIWHTFWLTMPNLPYLKRDLDILGWSGEKVSSLLDESDNSLLRLGAEVVLGVEEFVGRDGQKKQKNVIKFFNANFELEVPF